MKVLHYITFTLLAIGGLNWGLEGFFSYNLVEAVFGQGSLTMIIYSLVGLSALYEIFTHTKNCKKYKGRKSSSSEESSSMDMDMDM